MMNDDVALGMTTTINDVSIRRKLQTITKKINSMLQHRLPKFFHQLKFAPWEKIWRSKMIKQKTIKASKIDYTDNCAHY